MNRLISPFQGDGLMARVLRSLTWLMMQYGGTQALRLASNLILTRILFPEAFGLMALVSLVTIGLSLFSDIGLGPAISQNPRGDDPEFLDTAWVLQVIRGFALWLLVCLLALPVAQFYGEPDLAYYLPIAGLGTAIAGFVPTKVQTAHRHLLLGRLTMVELVAQAIGIGGMVIVALITQSVAALVLGGIFNAIARLILCNLFLPGRGNRFRWNRKIAIELMTFGKWIFLSTSLWFLISQGDRIVLGRYLSLEMLGLYNIGFFLASFPTQLGHSVANGLLIPIYRDRPPHASPENFRKLRLMRAGLAGGIAGLSIVMALIGPALVEFLYDDRYLTSAQIVTLMACALAPTALGMTYDLAALAAGDSRSYFIYSSARAAAQIGLILTGVIWYGLFGAILAMGLTSLVTYPILVWLARRHRVWDPLLDLVFWSLTGLLCALALWVHWDEVIGLIGVIS
ncbi:MAG: oligosaccharide flippase family protein [Pseudodonghicola sp.]|nr:oligosaccharide flippase family protein [Pseudodonghicola sp.]